VYSDFKSVFTWGVALTLFPSISVMSAAPRTKNARAMWQCLLFVIIICQGIIVAYLIALPFFICLLSPGATAAVFVCRLVDGSLRRHFYTAHLLINSIVNPEASASFKALLKQIYVVAYLSYSFNSPGSISFSCYL
jgi:prepilin signal peptidase PulO-like enzyme (type II secretory pathway)